MQTKAFRAFPDGDTPSDIRPLTSGGIGAMIAGLAQVQHVITHSMDEAARVMAMVTGQESPPASLKDPDGFVRFLAEQWLRSYGAYVGVEFDESVGPTAVPQAEGPSGDGG